MASESETLEKMSEVLDESEWDNLSIDFENGRGIEFANFRRDNNEGGEEYLGELRKY